MTATSTPSGRVFRVAATVRCHDPTREKVDPTTISKTAIELQLDQVQFAIAVVNSTLYVAQGRNEVRWRPGQEASLAPPCSNLRSFGSKCTMLKKVLVTLLGLFGAS